MANYDGLLRWVMGVLPTGFTLGKMYEYPHIYDNVSLLYDELLKQVNAVILRVGHEVFKNIAGSFRLKMYNDGTPLARV